MKKKNILLLVNQLHTGGAQKVIANLSINLSELYNVFLVIYNDINNITFDYKGNLVKIQLPYDQNTHLNSFPKRLTRFISLVRQVRKIKKEHNIHVAISFLEASNIVNIISRRKEKLILSVRSYLSHEFKDHPRLRIFKSLIKVLYNRATNTVVPSQLLKKDLTENFGVNEKKVRVIYNFTDQELVQKLVQEEIPIHHENIFRSYPVLINVGRITSPKAQWLLVPVVAKLKQEFPSLKLVILGEGILKQELIDTAIAAGLGVYSEGETSSASIDNYDIYLLGFIKNPFPYLERSHIFIKSSVYEGFPNVIIEAMSCNLPIISSDCESGPREILSPNSNILETTDKLEYAEYGVLVPAGEKYPPFAIEAVRQLLADTGKINHYKSSSKKRSTDYNKDKIIGDWIKLIEEV